MFELTLSITAVRGALRRTAAWSCYVEPRPSLTASNIPFHVMYLVVRAPVSLCIYIYIYMYICIYVYIHTYIDTYQKTMHSNKSKVTLTELWSLRADLERFEVGYPLLMDSTLSFVYVHIPKYIQFPNNILAHLPFNIAKLIISQLPPIKIQ